MSFNSSTEPCAVAGCTRYRDTPATLCWTHSWQLRVRGALDHPALTHKQRTQHRSSLKKRIQRKLKQGDPATVLMVEEMAALLRRIKADCNTYPHMLDWTKTRNLDVRAASLLYYADRHQRKRFPDDTKRVVHFLAQAMSATLAAEAVFNNDRYKMAQMVHALRVLIPKFTKLYEGPRRYVGGVELRQWALRPVLQSRWVMVRADKMVRPIFEHWLRDHRQLLSSPRNSLVITRPLMGRAL